MKAKVATFGEIMLRLSTMENKRFIQSGAFQADYGGGEANVAVSLANFGIETSFISKIPNNPLGDAILGYLRANKVNTKDIVLGGERLGTYYLEVGNGTRGSSVIYDRKYSSFSTVSLEEINFEEALKDVTLIHISGITPALSKNCKNLNLTLAKKAKEMGILVSFDFNYRGKLWTLEEAGETLKEYLPYIDICFAGHLDAENILKISIEKSTIKTHEELLEAYYFEILKSYPNIKYFSATKRNINSVDNNDLVGYIYTNGVLYKSKEYNFNILDRVGGGDAFSAGILYGILENMDSQNIVEFGVAASVLKHSIKGDANLVSVEEVKNLIENGAGKISR